MARSDVSRCGRINHSYAILTLEPCFSGGNWSHVHHEKHPSAPHVSARSGRDPGAAAAGFHGSGAIPAQEDGGEPASLPAGICVRPAWRDYGQVDSHHGRRGLRDVTDTQASGAFPRPPEHRQRTWASRRRFTGGAFVESDDLVERRSSETDPGHRCLRGRHSRSSGRASHRPGYDSAVDGVGH